MATFTIKVRPRLTLGVMANGLPVAPAQKGEPGDPGKSAYQIWLDAGNFGSEHTFLQSQKGEPGTSVEVANGAKSSDTNAGERGQMSIEGAFLYICTKSGEAGNATWLKAELLTTVAEITPPDPDPTPMSETNLLDMGLLSEDIDARLIYHASIGTNNTTIDIRGNGARTPASNAAVKILAEENNCYILEDY